MNKIYKLTLNEIIKQYKKKSIVIITALIFLVATALPFVIKQINNVSTNYAIENYKYQIQMSTDQIANIKGDKISLKYLETNKAYNEFLIDNNVVYGSWQYISAQNYFEDLIKIDTIELLQEGANSNEITKKEMYLDPSKIEAIINTPKDQLSKMLYTINANKDKIYNDIKNNDYLSYLKIEMDQNNAQINDFKKQSDILQKELANKDANKVQVQKSIDSLNNKINTQKKLLDVLNYRYENKIPIENNNWKSATLDNIVQNIHLACEPPLSKDEYIQSNNSSVDYSQYIAKYNSENKIYTDNINKDWYSLKNNIAQAQFEVLARNSVNSLVGIYTIIASIMVVIIAGGIVSSEFSKNTIKLLMIRPVSRFKIILSKLLSIFVIGYVILFASVILTTIVSGCIFGFADLAIPTIKMAGSTIVTQNYILSLGLHTLFYSISMVFIGTLAFAISTVTKSTAVAVAVSVLLFIGSMPMTLLMLSKNYIWFANTPIPYINLTSLSMTNDFARLFDSSAILNSTLGAIELLVLSVIFAIIAFVYFIKTDIKQ